MSGNEPTQSPERGRAWDEHEADLEHLEPEQIVEDAIELFEAEGDDDTPTRGPTGR